MQLGGREGYPVDPALQRVKTPRVAEKELTTYTDVQVKAVLDGASDGWPALCVRVLLGTGMRISEFCDLRLEDFEDDGDTSFLQVRRGKGPSSGACRSAPSYGETCSAGSTGTGRTAATITSFTGERGLPVTVGAVQQMLKRLGAKVGTGSTPTASATPSPPSTCAATARRNGCARSSATPATRW